MNELDDLKEVIEAAKKVQNFYNCCDRNCDNCPFYLPDIYHDWNPICELDFKPVSVWRLRTAGEKLDE